ncbi:MAG: protein translocase subunit SecD [Chloroflexi bacterium]|nr:protein translocase subunit SecD [Chloroflexota bacterium]
MSQRNYGLLIGIIVLVAAVIWIDLPTNPGIHIFGIDRSLTTQLGLDLQGGLQVLLQADLPQGSTVTTQQLQDAATILENRANGLGVSEVFFQVAGGNRIVGEFPGLKNPDQVLAVLKETGQLEFVNMGNNPVPVGTVIKTDLGQSSTTTPSASGTPGAATTPSGTGTSVSTPSSTPGATSAPTTTPTSVPSSTPTASGTSAAAGAAGATPTPGASPTPGAAETVYHTIMTGDQLSSVTVTTNTVGQYEIAFTLKPEGEKIFADYTSSHVGQYLAIVLDKKVISTPVVNSAITQGSGVIQGNFTLESANALAIQLRYGSLPVPLKIVESQSVGATLGQDSIRKSIIAGIAGLAMVVLFMMLYYRLPGVLADMALAIYTGTTFALFKLIPVTLTMPGIAAFVLTIGVAVDANILIFERLKEELRAGRTLRQAIDLGWQRAWPSIRDSNISTLITSVILFYFGSTFGASIVQGFALTLGIGVLVSLFTAVVVTRTFLHLVLDNLKFTEHPRWFGA